MQPASPQRSRFFRWRLVVALLAVVAAVAAGVGLERNYFGTRKISPSGGLYFFRHMELPVALYAQNDPVWGRDPLGPTDQTLGEAGCAVSSAAMVLHFYGVDTDPRRLNSYLNEHEGFTPQGWMYWEKAAELGGGHVKHAYEDAPSYYLIDSNLARGNPVIVRIRLASGLTHFVVIMGKEGFDYLIRDPSGAGVRRGVYPLKDFHTPIEALRFYERV